MDHDPLLDGPPAAPRIHKVDRWYAFFLAVTVALVVLLIGMGYRTTAGAKSRAERDADRAAIVADQVRGQLTVALEQLARDAVKDRCRDDYNTSVNSARVGNEIAFNRYVTGLGTGGDVPTLQAALDAAGQTLIAAQQAASAASAAGYTPEHCP